MSDYSELKRLAEAALRNWPDSKLFERPECDRFTDACRPDVVLGLLAENAALRSSSAEQHGRDSEELRKLCQHRDQLKAENEALRQERDSQQRLCIAEIGKNEALRKQIDDMSSFKGAPLTGPDLKCLECGGYHYGMIGLPCPKMAPHASAAMSQGEKP